MPEHRATDVNATAPPPRAALLVPCSAEPLGAGTVRLGLVGPDELAPYVGRHVHGMTLSFGIAGQLRAVEGTDAVIVNGFGVHRQKITGLWWLAHPGPFRLNGRPLT